jgi:hypothetical protein
VGWDTHLVPHQQNITCSKACSHHLSLPKTCGCLQLAAFCACATRPLSIELHCHVSPATARDGEEATYKEALMTELAARHGPPHTAVTPGNRWVGGKGDGGL